MGVEEWVFRKSLRMKLYFGSDLDPGSITSIHVSAAQISTGPSYQSQWRSVMILSASLDSASSPSFTS